jgi:hypothetical protein
MMAMVGGVASLVLGIIGIIVFWSEFINLLQGGIPIMLILGGALAAYLGYEEIKDTSASENLDTDTSDLKGEVESLKEEIKELKGQKQEPEKSEGKKA